MEIEWALKRARVLCCKKVLHFLTAESVEGTALALQSVDDVHGSDGLSLGVLSVGDGISDDVLKEDLEDSTGLFVDEARDTLDTTTTRKTADGRLGDTLDVIAQHFAMTLGASLSEALSSFAASRHDSCELGLSVGLKQLKWQCRPRPVFICQNLPSIGPVKFFKTA